MHVLVIGDVHGKIGGYFDLLDDFVERYSRSQDLYSLQLGDFGFGDTYTKRENEFGRSRHLDSDKHVFFGGNHDDYDRYGQVDGALGDFGEIPFIEDSFFVRGAFSIDKESRTLGKDWWKEEELGWKQSKNALDRYIETKPKHVFTHDGPAVVTEKMFPEKETFSSNTGKLLSEMIRQHKPKTWTFGHWHETKKFEFGETTFQCLGELETTTHNE